MEFGLIVFAGLGVVLVALLALGRWYPGTGADVLDWTPTRSYEDEARLEAEDVEQMLEAQNERRRRDGRPELSEADIVAQVEADEAELRERAARERARRGDDR